MTLPQWIFIGDRCHRRPARTGSRSARPRPRWVGLAAIIGQAVVAAAAQIAGENLTITVNAQPNYILYADGGRLQQVSGGGCLAAVVSLTVSASVTTACVAGTVRESAAAVRSIAAPGCAAAAIPPVPPVLVENRVERPRESQPDDCTQYRRAEDSEQTPDLLCWGWKSFSMNPRTISPGHIQTSEMRKAPNMAEKPRSSQSYRTPPLGRVRASRRRGVGGAAAPQPQTAVRRGRRPDTILSPDGRVLAGCPRGFNSARAVRLGGAAMPGGAVLMHLRVCVVGGDEPGCHQGMQRRGTIMRLADDSRAAATCPAAASAWLRAVASSKHRRSGGLHG